jgi:hypothetical protein
MKTLDDGAGTGGAGLLDARIPVVEPAMLHTVDGAQLPSLGR